MLNSEPTLIVYSILTGLNSVQWAAISMPSWAHLAITVVSGSLAAFVNRAKVTPYQ